MKILYGILIILGVSVSDPISAQTQNRSSTAYNDDCTNPEKRASRDSTCVSGSALVTAKQVTPSSMGNTKIIIPYQSCTSPWGSTVSDGGTVQAFLAPSATTCSEETRYCMGGVLSGSYQYQSCTTGATCGPVNQVESGACPTGYSGTRSRTNAVDTCTNTVTSYGTWDNSSCSVTAYSSWESYCNTTALTPNSPGDPNYEEHSEWGWVRYDLNTGTPEYQVIGSNTTRGGAEYSSTPNGSQSCWTPYGMPPN